MTSRAAGANEDTTEIGLKIWTFDVFTKWALRIHQKELRKCQWKKKLLHTAAYRKSGMKTTEIVTRISRNVMSVTRILVAARELGSQGVPQ